MPNAAGCPASHAERVRLATLHGYGVLDTRPEPAFDDVARVAAIVCGTENAFVNFVDEARQWTKATAAGPLPDQPREVALCNHVVAAGAPLVVEDALSDPRFRDSPLVTGVPGIRFYAGAPVTSRDGYVLGTVCVVDTRPRPLTPPQLEALCALARQASALLEMRRNNALLAVECEERERAERALRTSESRFRRLAAAAVDGIVISDGGRIVEASDAFCAMVGADPATVVGRRVAEFAAPEASAEVGSRLAADAEGRYQTRVRRTDGTTFPVEVSARDLDVEGHTTRVAVVRDISERFAVERMKNEFVSTVSHELRTPLTSIRGALGLLEGGAGGALSDRGRDLVRIARTNTDRLVRLINNILDLEKMEAGKLSLGLAMLEPADVVASTLEGIEGVAEQEGVRLAARLATFAAFPGDRDRLIQVLTNLVSNAIKFSPRGAEVVVRVSAAAAGRVRFAVADSGPGIRPEDRAVLFQKFGQIDGSDTRSRGGTGLGLAISRAIVEEHGGEIGVASTFGAGSEFWFELPATAPGPIAPAPLSASR